MARLFSKIYFVLLSWFVPVFVFAQSPTHGTIENPLGNGSTLCTVVANVLRALFIVGFPIAVLFIAFAGFKFVVARGNAEALDVARRNFLYVIIGIMVFFGAVVIAGVLTGTINQFLTSGQQISQSCRF